MGAHTESAVEQAALAWSEAIGWRRVYRTEIAPDTLAGERRGYGEVATLARASFRIQASARLAGGGAR